MLAIRPAFRPRLPLERLPAAESRGRFAADEVVRREIGDLLVRVVNASMPVNVNGRRVDIAPHSQSNSQ